MSPEKLLRLVLYLLAIHSICVGLALITTPTELFAYFGYIPVAEKFFPTQGGVFHIIMGIAYFLAARYVNKEQGLIILTIIAKLTATLFLVLYYVFVRQVWMILVSGILDALMATVILVVFLQYKKEQDQRL